MVISRFLLAVVLCAVLPLAGLTVLPSAVGWAGSGGEVASASGARNEVLPDDFAGTASSSGEQESDSSGSATESEPRVGSRSVVRAPLDVVEVLVPFRPPATRFGAGHRGVDLTAEAGTAVVSPGDGIVTFAGTVVDRELVVVEHAEFRSTLEPITPIVVAGQSVIAGQILGYLVPGHARCAPLACLHWGVRVNDEYVDPLVLLRPPRVRLLPWDG
jgi:murein DD-endopeptidase MepM/ murein hydrolase activator NlpD